MINENRKGNKTNGFLEKDGKVTFGLVTKDLSGEFQEAVAYM